MSKTIYNFLGVAMAFALSIAPSAQAEPGPGTLKAQFFYSGDPGDPVPDELKKYCPSVTGKAREGISAPIADIAVTLAGKAVESLIDSMAARTQAEATTLDVTVPIKGFFGVAGGDQNIAVNQGCLLFHNGKSLNDTSNASVLMSLRVIRSEDGTAFRFDVIHWTFTRFLKPLTSRWFQDQTRRDFAIKIELLTPASSGLGTRSVFIEQLFQGIDEASLDNAFFPGQQLPWFSAPPQPPSAVKDGIHLPLNIRITLVETTKPNQFAQWMQDLAKEKKSDISTAVKDAVRKSLDSNFAASEQMKLAETAASTYAAYKAAWDDGFTHKAAEPKKPGDTVDEAIQAKYNADKLAWDSQLTIKIQNVSAKRVLAQSAFQAADLRWPGDLPSLAKN